MEKKKSTRKRHTNKTDQDFYLFQNKLKLYKT